MIEQIVIFFQIVFIDLVLAGDNAIIIGMVASQFKDDVRKKIIFWGIGAAIVLRIIFTLITAYLLQINGLKTIGGLLLLYIAYRLYKDVIKNEISDNKKVDSTTRSLTPYQRANIFPDFNHNNDFFIRLKNKNSTKNNLGVPLPQGKIKLFQTTPSGKIEFVGEDEIRQVPKGANATIISGRAFDVIGKRSVVNYDRQRKSEEGSISITVTNTLPQNIKVRLIEHIYGDWVIRNASTNYRKEDASTIHFSINIPADGFSTVTYTYRKEWK